MSAGLAARLAGGEMKDHVRVYAVVGVVLGLTMASFLLLTSYEQYMLQISRDGIAGTISGDGLVLDHDVTLREAYGGAPRMNHAPELVRHLESTGRYAATPRLTLQGVVFPPSGAPEGAILRGIDPRTDERVFQLKDKVVVGRYFQPDDPATQDLLGRTVAGIPPVSAGPASSDNVTRDYVKAYPAIVGRAFLESRGLKVGDVVRAAVQTGGGTADYHTIGLRIIGAYDIGLPVMEQVLHFVHIDSAREITGWGADAATEVAVDDLRNARLAEPEQVAADLKVLAPASASYTWHDVLVYVSGTLMDTVNLLLYGTMTVTLFLAAAAIHHVMDGIVLRKTREIGSLKAFGARDRTILQVFLFQALAIGAMAGALGVALGYAVVSWARAAGLQTEFLAGSAIKVDFVVTPQALLLVLALPIALCLVASAPPALHAARLPPVEALRRGELAA